MGHFNSDKTRTTPATLDRRRGNKITTCGTSRACPHEPRSWNDARCGMRVSSSPTRVAVKPVMPRSSSDMCASHTYGSLGEPKRAEERDRAATHLRNDLGLEGQITRSISVWNHPTRHVWNHPTKHTPTTPHTKVCYLSTIASQTHSQRTALLCFRGHQLLQLRVLVSSATLIRIASF